MGSCHRHDLFFLSRLHIGEEIIGIVIAEADNRIGDANRSFVRITETAADRSESPLPPQMIGLDACLPLFRDCW